MSNRGWNRVVWLLEDEIDYLLETEEQVFVELRASRHSDGEDEGFVSIDEAEAEYQRLRDENDRLRDLESQALRNAGLWRDAHETLQRRAMDLADRMAEQGDEITHLKDAILVLKNALEEIRDFEAYYVYNQRAQNVIDDMMYDIHTIADEALKKL